MIFTKPIRTRFAPSPTGPLHIGGVRTALFNFLFAKKHKGKFILRIEDTDVERSDALFENDITEGLKWLGLIWDEGPYRQSDQARTHRDYLETLFKKKAAFWCPHSRKELVKEREEQMQKKSAAAHFCSSRENSDINQAPEKGAKNEGVIRFKNDWKGKEIKFQDLIRGEVSVKGEILGDFSLAKNLDAPLYNFAVVIDDSLMKISHIIRGEDHISNTPKQILIQEALGLKRPVYAHLPLILGKDRSKLSKRNAVVSVNAYRHQGYLAEAILNFLALLGWHPKQLGCHPKEDEKEILSINQLLKEFNLENAQKGGAIFDMDKLNWFNQHYLKKIPLADLERRLLEYLPESWQKEAKSDSVYWRKIIELERARLVKLSDIKESAEYFFEKPHYPKELLLWKDQKKFSEVKEHLQYLKIHLENFGQSDFNKDKLREFIMPYAEKHGRGNVLWPFRAALTGRRFSPDPFEVAGVLGKEKSAERLDWAIESVKNS
ncbi:MAG: glutamate--tRNA ligase [Patescibacteria group bacterium]